MVQLGEEMAGGAWLAPATGGVGALGSWIAADGSARLASSGSDGTIQIWNAERGDPVGPPLLGHSDNLFRLIPHTWDGGTILASAGEDGIVRTWNVDAATPTSIPMAGHHGWVKALAFWTDGAGRPFLASAGVDRTVRIWDPRTGDQIGPAMYTAEIGLGALASWSEPEGNRLAVADDAGNITIWDPDARRMVDLRPMVHWGGMWTSLAAWTARDGSACLASGGHDGTILRWNATTGEQIGEPLQGHHGWVPALVTWGSPAGDATLASAGTDGKVLMWDCDSGRQLNTPLGRVSGALAAVATWVSSDGGRRLAFAGIDSVIRSYDVDTGRVVSQHRVSHVAGVWTVINWPNDAGTRIASSGDDAVIRIFNADTGQAVGQPLVGHTAAVWAMSTWPGRDRSTMLASAGDDGTIRLWDVTSGTSVGQPLATDAGWVLGLATWRRPDGSIALASTSNDGTVRRWDPVRRIEIGEPLRGHRGQVLAVVTWRGRSGARIASGGEDGTVRLWDPDRGEAVGPALSGHTGWVRTLAVCPVGSRTLLISGSYDATIRIWDAETGAQIGQTLPGPGRVGALAAWSTPDGQARLAAAGDNGSIQVWDLGTHKAVGEPLVGHGAGVWALTSWSGSAGMRLASAGQDGSVRLWDPDSGHALRTIEIGPVSMWGISDAPTKRDVVGRQALAEAIADQLRGPTGMTGTLPTDGPTVVSVEGPWGCGKSTLMNLIRERLPAPPPAAARRARRHMTVRAVGQEIRRYAARPARDRSSAGPPPPAAAVTAWFNPWEYQSGAQIWAGLANEIIEAAADVLYPTEPARERYWLVRNLDRIDRYALRRAMHQRTRSPIFGVAIAALITPVVIALTGLDRPVGTADFKIAPVLLATATAMVTLLAGVVHTAWRYWFGRAVDYLPAGLLSGPVVEPSTMAGHNPAEPDADPLHRASAGALYLHQHNIGDLVDDLALAGYDLVVFVDDIDRCRPGTIAEVFEAVNLFLSHVTSRSGLRAHFVVGLDPAVVSSHLDETYTGGADPTVGLHGDDPTPGWAFLRKLIQLPVLVPAVPDEGVRQLVDSITRPAPAGVPADPPVGRSGHPSVGQRSRPSAVRAPAPAQGQFARPRIPAPRAPVDTFTWRSAERHPEMRNLLVQRLMEQPYRSIREAKRLINAWQFYERILEKTEPLADPAAMIVRARRLIILAEIVTRWPALQRALHRHLDGRRGLQLLAATADVDDDWQQTVQRLGIERLGGEPSLANLRALLRTYDGRGVADLAARLM